MRNPDKKPLIHKPIEAGDHINGQIQSFLKSIAADTNLGTKRIMVGTAFLPKGQKSGESIISGEENQRQPGQNQLILMPEAADEQIHPMETMDGDIGVMPCAPAKYIDGKFYIAGAECASTPFHGISFYLGNPANEGVDGGGTESVINYAADSNGDVELQAGGVLWVQDFRLDKPTLATITLQGSNYAAEVKPAKHVGIIFHSIDEASVYSAQGDTEVNLAYLPQPEQVEAGQLKTFSLNEGPQDSQSNLSCNVGQVRPSVTYTHIPQEMLENFLVISFVVILTVSRKMGTVTRHSERPKQG